MSGTICCRLVPSAFATHAATWSPFPQANDNRAPSGENWANSPLPIRAKPVPSGFMVNSAPSSGCFANASRPFWGVLVVALVAEPAVKVETAIAATAMKSSD